MKKIVFMLAAMMLCAFSLSAQKEVKLRFGVLGGFNMTKWNGDGFLPDYNSETKEGITPTTFSKFEDAGFTPGFHVGALADMVINDKWSIQPELLFTFEGSKVAKVTESFEVKESKYTALFIKIPLIVLSFSSKTTSIFVLSFTFIISFYKRRIRLNSMILFYKST